VGVREFKNMKARGQFGSIYQNTTVSDKASYDDVLRGEKNLSNYRANKGLNLEMKKQTKRNYNNLLMGTEAFKNIQRDNEREDFIKNLLS
jgi:hypothetical protein